ncbi:MAG: T9SS type A sorting domain-containing protein [Calditrichaeota bacterium]|nr:T9SS type A sorting domain-containing protein [Calditrichota bacterium]
MKSAQHITSAVLIGLLLVVLVPGFAVAQAYDLFFVPNSEFERNLDGWFFIFVENSEVDNRMGTASWSAQYGGSLHLTASGQPLGSAGVAAGINTFLCPGDTIICRYTMPSSGQIHLNLGGTIRPEWSQSVSSRATGTREFAMVINKVYLPGTLFGVHLSAWNDSPEAWIHSVRIGRGGGEWLRAPGSGYEPPPIPSQSLLNPPFPNPTNAGAQIKFNLVRPSSAAMRIYDVQGRLIRDFSAKPYGVGEHTVVWDGKSDSGMPVTSGTYFYELEADGQRHLRQAVILK